MDKERSYNELRKLALDEGMALFGVADVTPVRDTFLLPADVAGQFSAGISLGFHLSKMALATVTDAPSQIYYFHYQRVNILLDQTALKLTSWIQQQGYEALPIPASQVIDWEKQLGSVSHREVAYRAGHGWYGRNNLLVNPAYGSAVRYVTVLTDMPLKTDAPLQADCGGCSACVSLCPAGAISAAGFDRDRCHAKLKEFTKIQRIGQMICGVCLKVCPGKRK
jgi:epoxyqueuosine reductase QueG